MDEKKEEMKLYREVKASERLPIICDEWYYTDIGMLVFDFGTWYSTDADDRDSTYEAAPKLWLEPIEITEEEIRDCVKYIEQNPEATERLTAEAILTLLKEKR